VAPEVLSFERGRYPQKESMVTANTQPVSSMSVTAATMGEPSVVVVSLVGSVEGSAGMVKSVTVGSEVVYWLRYELSVLMSASTKLSTVGVWEVGLVVEVEVGSEAVVEGVWRKTSEKTKIKNGLGKALTGSSTLHKAYEQPRFAPPEFNWDGIGAA
jgi:hypothetical protein